MRSRMSLGNSWDKSKFDHIAFEILGSTQVKVIQEWVECVAVVLKEIIWPENRNPDFININIWV